MGKENYSTIEQDNNVNEIYDNNNDDNDNDNNHLENVNLNSNSNSTMDISNITSSTKGYMAEEDSNSRHEDKSNNSGNLGGGAILNTNGGGDTNEEEEELNEDDFISVKGESHLNRIYIKSNTYDKILNYSSKMWVNSGIYKNELILTFSYLCCFIALGISVGSLGPTLLALARNTNSTLDQVGYFFSSRGAGYFVGSFCARVFDKIKNGNYLIAASVNLMAISLFCIPLIKNIWVAGIVFAIEGFGAGFIDSGLNTMIVWLWKDSVNPFMQLLHFSFGVGAFIAPLVISQLSNKSLFSQYMVLAIIMFASSFSIMFLKSAAPYHETQEQTEPISKKEKKLRIEVIAAIALFLFWYVGAEAGFGGWIASYATLNLNFSEEKAALLTSLFWGSFTLFRACGVILSLLMTPQQMVILDTAICFFFTILLILFKNSVFILWVSVAGLGVGLASIFPTAFSLPQNLNMPISSVGTSYMVIGATLGELTIPWLTGVCQHHIGTHTLPYITLLTLIVSLIIYIGINIRAKYIRATDRGETFDLSFSTPLDLIK